MTQGKLPFAVAIPAGWNIRQRVRPTIEHMSLFFAQFIVPYRPPVTVPKMRLIMLSRPFLFFGGIEKAERLEMIPPKQGFDFIWFCMPFEKQQNKLLA